MKPPPHTHPHPPTVGIFVKIVFICIALRSVPELLRDIGILCLSLALAMLVQALSLAIKLVEALTGYIIISDDDEFKSAWSKDSDPGIVGRLSIWCREVGSSLVDLGTLIASIFSGDGMEGGEKRRAKEGGEEEKKGKERKTKDAGKDKPKGTMRGGGDEEGKGEEKRVGVGEGDIEDLD